MTTEETRGLLAAFLADHPEHIEHTGWAAVDGERLLVLAAPAMPAYVAWGVARGLFDPGKAEELLAQLDVRRKSATK